MAEDAAGNQVHITLANIGPVTKENGRLFLHANGEKIDITDELVETGSYHDTYEMTVGREDGSEELRTITITVTGNLEAWTVTQDNGDGTATTTHQRLKWKHGEPGRRQFDTSAKKSCVCGG